MLCMFKGWLLKILGGVTDHEHQKAMKEKNALSAELETHREFIASIYFYAGNYPAWKAQQEYREYLLDIGHPLKRNYSITHPENREQVDIYLGRIVDGFSVLNKNGYFRYGDDHFSNEHLSNARGDNYLTS